MISYLLKLFVLILFSVLIIFNYYWNRAHIENFNWYFVYTIWLFIFYWVYKFFQISSLKEKITFTPIKIFWYFFGHLILLSSLFFYYNKISWWEAFWDWLTLSFKILFYSLLPISISLISLSFGQFSLKNILDKYEEKSSNYKFLTWIWFGFFAFIFSLTIVWMLGFYNLYSVFGILILFSILSYKELIKNISGIFSYKIECKNHQVYSDSVLEQINPKLLSSEFFFIVISLVLSVNLINIFRPFPIGWDDLWAYMNYPHLMANEWSVWFLGSMMSWQTFTWIWYMFHNPTLAFFLNDIWGFVSVIVIALIISEIFKNKKQTFINLPLLASMLFISMPMVVFQQAKDMKLDEWLFFISIIALYMLFEFYNNYTSPLASFFKDEGNNEKKLSKKAILKLFLVVWILLGFAFSIKFTSLLLISGVLGILFFTRLWILGFLWYISLYFSIFTFGGLWKMMNVVGLENPEIKSQVWLIGAIVWIAFLVTARLKYKKRFRRFIPRILAIFVWIFIAVSPWAINNINQAGKVWISQIISWKPEHFVADFSKIYSKEKLEEIQNKSKISSSISSSWTTKNEDLGRYFGYEKGINNYIKLPWNLTMQKNQKWEFTDIWFIFLALLPALLLFLPFRKRYFSLWVYALLFFEVLLFVMPLTNSLITQFLASFTLPYWYILILLFFLLPLIFLIPTVQNKSLEKLFKINLIFTIFYTFLWAISAFWIVWYWIVMYFNFILLIIFWAYYLWSYDKDSLRQERQIKFFGTLIFISIILVYIFLNVFPHSFNNLKNASYIEYKQGKITIAEAPYLYHREYLKILFNLNIDKQKRKEFILNNIEWEELKNIFKNNLKEVSTNWKIDIDKTINLFTFIILNKKIDNNLKFEAKKTIQNIYSWISEPSKKFRSKANVFRIGTFLKYNISQNYKRLYEDSLLNDFEKYFYDKNPDITVERMKKFGLSYLLVDLNAATIDKDPRHALTKRYEELLETMTSKKMKLIETDSVCLKIALENYNYSKQKDKDVFKILAWVNYESYTKDWKQIPRTSKKIVCYKTIIKLANENKINKNHYSYLLKDKAILDKLKDINKKLIYLNRKYSYSGKALFELK